MPINFAENRQEWVAALDRAFGDQLPELETWTQPDLLALILNQFCKPNFNHLFLPFGGGMDALSVLYNFKTELLEIQIDSRLVYVCRPKSLEFVRVTDSIADSFFLLTADALAPSGVYETHNGRREELLELPGGKLVK